MKNTVRFILIILALSSGFFGCKKSNDSLEIVVKTGKNQYVVNDKIDVSVTNHLTKQANYFICDNVGLSPSKFLKYNNGKWTEYYYPAICTAMGPAGFYGVLNASYTKFDTLTLPSEIGQFKLRYTFIVNNDTLNYDSNEILINELD
jgi:hypothetical protein